MFKLIWPFSEIRKFLKNVISGSFFLSHFECNHCQTVRVLSQLSLRDLWANNSEYGIKINISQPLRGISKNNNYWNSSGKHQLASIQSGTSQLIFANLTNYSFVTANQILIFFVLYASACLLFVLRNHCIPQAPKHNTATITDIEYV